MPSRRRIAHGEPSTKPNVHRMQTISMRKCWKNDTPIAADQAKSSIKGLIRALSPVRFSVRSGGIVLKRAEGVVGNADAATRSGVITLSLASRGSSSRPRIKAGASVCTVAVASMAAGERTGGLRRGADRAEIVDGAIVSCVFGQYIKPCVSNMFRKQSPRKEDSSRYFQEKRKGIKVSTYRREGRCDRDHVHHENQSYRTEEKIHHRQQ